jgi:MFS family permease
MKTDSLNQIDRFFIRNTAGITAVEFFWGIAMPVVFESTFLQIFLKNIGANNKIIGLIPSILAAGLMLFALVSAWTTSHLVKKKGAVIITHIIPAIPFIIFGIILPWLENTDRVRVFILTYIIFAVSIGMTLPLWQNFIVKIFSPEKSIKAISIMMSVQISARLMGSFIIYKAVEKYTFSISSSSVIFILVGILFFSGSFFFLIVNEADINITTAKQHTLKTISAGFINIVKNRNFILYLASMAESYANVAVISFYANYAVEFKGIEKETAAGIFTVFIYAGGILANILFGWFNLYSLKIKIVLARIFAVSGTFFLLFSQTLVLFLIVSFLFGISRGINQFTYSPAVKKLSGMEDATDYFALSLILVFPLSFGIPFISGILIDSFSSHRGFSYLTVFILLGLIQAAGLVFTMYADFQPVKSNTVKTGPGIN